MNNFIFENATKVYFGRGCVKEYLSSVMDHYGKTVMLAMAAVLSREMVSMKRS